MLAVMWWRLYYHSTPLSKSKRLGGTRNLCWWVGWCPVEKVEYLLQWEITPSCPHAITANFVESVCSDEQTTCSALNPSFIITVIQCYGYHGIFILTIVQFELDCIHCAWLWKCLFCTQYIQLLHCALCDLFVSTILHAHQLYWFPVKKDILLTSYRILFLHVSNFIAHCFWSFSFFSLLLYIDNCSLCVFFLTILCLLY